MEFRLSQCVRHVECCYAKWGLLFLHQTPPRTSLRVSDLSMYAPDPASDLFFNLVAKEKVRKVNHRVYCTSKHACRTSSWSARRARARLTWSRLSLSPFCFAAARCPSPQPPTRQHVSSTAASYRRARCTHGQASRRVQRLAIGTRRWRACPVVPSSASVRPTCCSSTRCRCSRYHGRTMLRVFICADGTPRSGGEDREDGSPERYTSTHGRHPAHHGWRCLPVAAGVHW